MNGWKRIWIVISVLSLIVTLFLIFKESPKEDLMVLRGIGMKECNYLLKIPEGFSLEEYSDFGSPCFRLAMFLKNNNTTKIISIKDYRAYINNKRTKFIMAILGLWVGFIASIYGLGWTFVWVIKGFKSTPAK